jgi:DNA-binding protein HU-beta
MTIDGLKDVMVDALRREEKATLPGFLSVERVSRAERQGRHPRTGQVMTVPAGFSVKLTPGQSLKSAAKSAAAG